MRKLSPEASSEARDGKGLIKKITGGVLTIAMLAGLTVTAVACNPDSGNQNTPVNPNPPIDNPNNPDNPNTPSEDKTISVDTIFEENFSNVTFDAAFNNAFVKIGEKAIPNSDTEITGKSYNSSTDEIKLNVAYVEDGKSKTGSITFNAPEIYSAIRENGAKAVILDEADITVSEVKESEKNSVINQLQTAVNTIENEITSAFASISVGSMDIELQKDPEPVVTTTFDKIIDEELGDYLGNEAMFEESVRTMIKSFDFRFVVSDIKVAINDNKLICYFNDDYTMGTSFKSISPKNYTATDFEDYINATLDSAALLDKYFTYGEQNNNSIVVGSSEEKHIREVCENVVENIETQKTLMESIKKRTDFTGTGYCSNGSELSDEETKKFAQRLGYSSNQIVDVYVTNPQSGNFDTENIFNTGYLSGFDIAVLLNKGNGNYQLIETSILAPYYTNSTNESIWNGFLTGEENEKWVIDPYVNETVTDIKGVIKDFSAESQNNMRKIASVGEYDVYLEI